MRTKKVCVIGAGYSGLCALRHFLPDPNYTVTCFEQSASIGGVWKYPDGCEVIGTVSEDASSPFYSRMYRSLRTNSPKDIMALEGYHFPKDGPSYCSIPTVREYLENYAQYFDLLPHIKLRHRITFVTPLLSSKEDGNIGPRWSVRIEDLTTANAANAEAIFDIILVCTGKCHKPYYPRLHGMSEFKGIVLHSSEYRTPQIFANQNVLIVGGGPSAIDITVELAQFAKKSVIVSQNKPLEIFRPELSNVYETTEIINYTANGARLTTASGDVQQIDTIILCTGFLYDFPFLSPACHVMTSSRGRIGPLYRYLIHCEYPSMAFVFMLDLVSITPLLDCQVKFYKALLDGKFTLPTTEEMLADSEGDYQQQLLAGLPPHHAHRMGWKMWAYVDALIRDAGLETYEPVLRRIVQLRLEGGQGKDVLRYKNWKLERIDAENCVYEKC